MLLNIKCVLNLSTTLIVVYLFHSKKIQQNIITNLKRYIGKVPLVIFRVSWTMIFLIGFEKLLRNKLKERTVHGEANCCMRILRRTLERTERKYSFLAIFVMLKN
jgi:hypothetical protein